MDRFGRDMTAESPDLSFGLTVDKAVPKSLLGVTPTWPNVVLFPSLLHRCEVEKQTRLLVKGT